MVSGDVLFYLFGGLEDVVGKVCSCLQKNFQAQRLKNVGSLTCMSNMSCGAQGLCRASWENRHPQQWRAWTWNKDLWFERWFFTKFVCFHLWLLGGSCRFKSAETYNHRAIETIVNRIPLVDFTCQLSQLMSKTKSTEITSGQLGFILGFIWKQSCWKPPASGTRHGRTHWRTPQPGAWSVPGVARQ